MRKPAIEARQGHARGIDDIGELVIKGAKKALKDVADPKYTKKVYNKKGAITKDYKDYVLRNMKGDY